MLDAFEQGERNGNRLVTANYSDVVEVTNPRGRCPMLLICDHASRVIPVEYDNLGLPDAALRDHIAWDIGAAAVTRSLAKMLDAPAILCGFSRLLIDPNRTLDDPTSIPMVSDGIEVPGNRELDREAIEHRVNRFFRPYHAAIDDQIMTMTGRGPGPAILSIHSFTPIFQNRVRPWQAAILWNRDPRLPLPLLSWLQSAGYVVGDNEPYSGREGFGYTTHRHADARGLANALVELRQDLVANHNDAQTWAERLAEALAGPLSKPATFEKGDFL